jgi:hypothetical protein
MKLTDTKIVFLRNKSETWELFESTCGVQALPKYDMFIMIPEGKIGSRLDYRVIPSLRNKKNYPQTSRWATHYAIIAEFLKSPQETLFVCEDGIEIKSYQISAIESLILEKNKGMIFLTESNLAQAYIIDKHTAKIIIDNIYTYYNDFETMLKDMKKLDLIHIENRSLLNQIQNNNNPLLNLKYFSFNPSYLLFLIFFLILILCLSYFLPLHPSNSTLFSKNLIGSAKVFAPKETLVST